MTTQPNGTVLKITRGLILLIMGLVALVGLALAIASVVLPFYWTEAVAALLKEKPGTDIVGLLPQLYVIFAFIIAVMGIAWTIMRKLLAMIATVADGDPFVRANASRLKAIGWLMVGVQLLSIPLYFVAAGIAERLGKSHLDGEISLTSFLSILLVFVLAGVFEQGAAMREEMEGTV
jgi:Protein of unknown function (DUF2975)